MRPLHIQTFQERRRRRLRVLGVVAVLVVAGGIGYYVFRPSSATPPATTKPSPPVPVGIVTEIGTGGATGTGNGITLVNLGHVTSELVRSLTGGVFPDAVAVSPTRPVAYVTNYADDTITPIDLATGRAEKPMKAGPGPAGIAVTPNGKWAYVTDAGSSPLGDTVTPINLATGKPAKTIRVGAGPQGIAITPDGRRAYVANAGAIVTGQVGKIGHTVTPINLVTRHPMRAIDVGNAPIGVAVSSDGSTVFVTNSYSGSVSPISVAANAAGTPIRMPGTPQAVVAVPHRSEVLVANAATTSTDSVTTIGVASQTVGATITVPKNPTDLAVTPDGKWAWVVAYGSRTAVPINLKSDAVETQDTIHFANGPYAIGIASVPRDEAAKVFAVPKKAKKG